MIKIADEYKRLFEFSSVEQQIKHMATMNSLRIMSVVEENMDRLRMTRKELAQKCGTSGSYITQLFRGDKLVNMVIVAKFELALGMQFTVGSLTKIK